MKIIDLLTSVFQSYKHIIDFGKALVFLTLSNNVNSSKNFHKCDKSRGTALNKKNPIDERCILACLGYIGPRFKIILNNPFLFSFRHKQLLRELSC